MSAKCYCLTPLRNGVCPYRCPVEADPRHLRAQAAARKANDAAAASELRGQLLTPSDMQKAVEVPANRASRLMFTRRKKVAK
jgi:hypothetical protein